MQWSTPFTIPESPFPISHQSKILSMGSCFAQTIGQKMLDHKFDCLVSPFGTIFHPMILGDLLDHAMFQDKLEENGLIERDGMYYYLGAHSDLNGNSSEQLKKNYAFHLEETKKYLESGTHLILTLGTSWIYETEDFGRVANCHKLPQKLFRKRLVPLEEMVSHLSHVFGNISRAYPDLKIILTVSPVRHIKDGIPENQLSKSLLRVLCHELEKRLSNTIYFPAYEILIDELRDYRFYKEDLIHPSAEAENYIWEKWQISNFSEDTRHKVDQLHKINQDLAHKPLNPESEAHRKFLANLLPKLERLNTEFDFSREIADVKQKLEVLSA
ncbi:GSCFA domain-containing protein [Algoriphagus sp. D3-2-R+10]|uniref:GSCFA domain-containing protein n=1 Tax=Algoriphagus aurantiacus TaxID=3103948 RepID=UPI002B38AF33|nr:GSCFA domain-containing protein [Algoriphagus sp. D3-2-R+10]MEB2775146.1 GSCFA domain-containing protein [Algoriphagus sp. D3-2-R+10]